MERRVKILISNLFIHKISKRLGSSFKVPLISNQARKRVLILLIFIILLEIAKAHTMSQKLAIIHSQRTKFLQSLGVLNFLAECHLILKNYFKTLRDIWCTEKFKEWIIQWIPFINRCRIKCFNNKCSLKDSFNIKQTPKNLLNTLSIMKIRVSILPYTNSHNNKER